jgi:hypothetical protein
MATSGIQRVKDIVVTTIECGNRLIVDNQGRINVPEVFSDSKLTVDIGGNVIMQATSINFRNSTIDLTGASLLGSVAVTGNLNVSGQTTTQYLVVNDIAQLQGSLDVNGDTYFGSDVVVAGDLITVGTFNAGNINAGNIKTDDLYVHTIHGFSPISVVDITNFASDVTINGKLNVAGKTQLSSDLLVTGPTTLGNVTTSTLNVTGPTVLGTTLSVLSTSNLHDTSIIGNISVSGTSNLQTLNVFGATTLYSTLGVSGTSTLTNLQVAGNLQVSGSTLLNSLDVTGNVTLGGGLVVEGNLTSGNLILDNLFVHAIYGRSPINFESEVNLTKLVQLLTADLSCRFGASVKLQEQGKVQIMDGGSCEVHGGDLMVTPIGGPPGGGKVMIMDGGSCEVHGGNFMITPTGGPPGGGKVMIMDGGSCELSGGGHVSVDNGGDVMVKGGCFRLQGSTSAVVYQDTPMAATQSLLGAVSAGTVLTLKGDTYGPTGSAAGGISLYTAANFAAFTNLTMPAMPAFPYTAGSGYKVFNLGPLRNLYFTSSIVIRPTAGGVCSGTYINLTFQPIAQALEDITCMWRTYPAAGGSGVGLATYHTNGNVSFTLYNTPGADIEVRIHAIGTQVV